MSIVICNIISVFLLVLPVLCLVSLVIFAIVSSHQLKKSIEEINCKYEEEIELMQKRYDESNKLLFGEIEEQKEDEKKSYSHLS